jgi:hypothetical protein
MADAFVLQLAEEAEVKAREADRSKLRLATHWAERHRVGDVLEAAHWSDADLRDICEPIGGVGTPLVSEAAVTPLAASLGVSPRAAMQLMSDGLDLKYRLPKAREAVEELRLAPWRARRIANLTHGLSQQAAAWVDAELAPIADSCCPARIERAVQEAIARFDPAQQAQVEDQARAAWGVRLEDYSGPVWAGTSKLEITGDTPTLRKLYDVVCAKAHAQLDPARPTEAQPSLEQRKIRALGLIADGAGATTKTKLYLHLDATELPDPVKKLGMVERLGPLTVATIERWLATSRFTLQPVLDMSRTDAVDQYEPPAWMRELVILRDGTCVHPNCTVDARDCDLDHVEAYVATDDGGPPGQTRPENLAPLCRRHHRAKTHYGWSYQRNADGGYTWIDPFGRSYDVAPRGQMLSASTTAPAVSTRAGSSRFRATASCRTNAPSSTPTAMLTSRRAAMAASWPLVWASSTRP